MCGDPEIGAGIPWRDWFDRIVCFTHLPDAARRRAMERELGRVGILGSGIFGFAYTSPDPWEQHVVEAAPRVAADARTNAGFINLGLATARVLREAKWLGWRRVLFLEDDVRFLKDLTALKAAFARTPQGWNIVQYDKFVDWRMTPETYSSMVAGRRIGDTAFFDGRADFLPSGACFAADARAMAAMLERLERHGPRPVDALLGAVDVNRAVAIRNAAVQVAFRNALVGSYVGRNSHHLAYGPQGVDYSLYAVPDGYGYGTEFAVP